MPAALGSLRILRASKCSRARRRANTSSTSCARSCCRAGNLMSPLAEIVDALASAYGRKLDAPLITAFLTTRGTPAPRAYTSLSEQSRPANVSSWSQIVVSSTDRESRLAHRGRRMPLTSSQQTLRIPQADAILRGPGRRGDEVARTSPSAPVTPTR